MPVTPSPESSAVALECDAIFATPGSAERGWLYDALLGILQQISWLHPLLGDQAMRLALLELREDAWARTPVMQRDSPVKLLRGDFGTAGAVIGMGTAVQPRGLLTLRGLFWLSLQRWHRLGRTPRGTVEAIASALRSTAASPTSRAAVALKPILQDLEHAEDLGGAVRILGRLFDSAHEGLREAWVNGLRHILQEPSATDRPENPQASKPTRPLISPGVRTRRTPRDTERAELDPGTPDVHPLRRRAPFPGQLPNEPPEEFSEPADLVLVPGFGNGVLSRRQAEYRARQAVWSGNIFLLTTHPDALPPDVYGEALRLLVEKLEHGKSDDPNGRGYLVCLIKAISGRTTPGVASLHIGVSVSDTASQGLGLDLERGFMHFPPYWKDVDQPTDDRRTEEGSMIPLGFFHPKGEAQAKLLVPVCNQIVLPLVRPIHRALSRHQYVLSTLRELDPITLDQCAAEAASDLSSSLGIHITVAALRRSLGPNVVEATGDLALAQLVCGDSFGRPSAMQHYYAPRRKDIAQAYADAVGRHFAEHKTSAIPQAAARIGAELLVSARGSRQLAKASLNEMAPIPFEADDVAAIVQEHRRYLDHLARMILATAGHRPSGALFELTLHDIDLQTGAALFYDKRIDAAHNPRLACLPNVVCQQIEAYLHHLIHLGCRCLKLQPTVEEVLAGRAPLLFDLDDHGCAAQPTLEALRQRSPPEWSTLPWNWGRTYMRTRGIEVGAPPFLMSCQLGHLDAVGYPFSNQSPTEPLEVVRSTQPWLDRLVLNQGWSILDNLPSAKAPSGTTLSTTRKLPSLQDWQPRIKAAELEAQQAHEKWERGLRVDAKRVRQQAIQTVLEHPTLISSGIAAAYSGGHDSTPQPLTEADLCRIRDDLVDAVGDDAPAAVAMTRALRSIIAKVSSRTGQSYLTIPLPIPIRRPLDNAVFPGMCLALTQIQALRDHVKLRSSEKRPNRNFARQVARTAEALALFGFMDDPDRLLAIMEARAHALPSAKVPDLMLVPLADRYVVGLRGVAALALANLAQSFPSEPLPTLAQIESELNSLLPPWATQGSHDGQGLLARLCSTTAASNRFELSPAARFAVDPTLGSTHAELSEQLAFIDRDAVRPPHIAADAYEIPGSPTHQTIPRTPDRPDGTPRSQYRALCRLIPREHNELILPLTGKHIQPIQVQTAATRSAVLDELDAFLEKSTLWPIIRMLGDWTRSELRRERGKDKPLAYRTITTYLTRIGGALVEELGELDVARWDERVIEDAYLYALDASRDAKHKVAASLLAFHYHCAKQWDLPEIDLSPVYAELTRGRQQADSALILPLDRSVALNTLYQKAWRGTGENFESTRLARHADFIGYFLAWAGARLNEPLGLQVRDLGRRPNGMLWARLHGNRLRRLKTPAASRVLAFCEASEERPQRERVWQRTEDMRKHVGNRRPESAYLAADLAADKPTFPSSAIARTIRDSLSEATGRPSERLHRLRHLVATECLMQKVLASEDAVCMGWDISDSGLLTPRDLHGVSVPLGHSHWKTTIQWYLHLPWLLQSRAAARLRRDYFSRRHVAGALGYTPASLDSILRGRRVEPLVAWFDHFRPGRQPPKANPTNQKVETTSTGRQPWTPSLVGRLVDLATKSKDLEPAMRSIGAPMDQTGALIRYAERWEAKLGLRLLPTHVNGRKRACPGRALRRVHADKPLERMWRDVEADSQDAPPTHRQIVAAFFTWLRPSRDHDVLLPGDESHALIEWLGHIGLAREQVETTELSGGLVQHNILRLDTNGKSHGYHGLGLRWILVVAGLALDLSDAANKLKTYK